MVKRQREERCKTANYAEVKRESATPTFEQKEKMKAHKK
jgi:hypothetical protein